jgi:hypothetical protein
VGAALWCAKWSPGGDLTLLRGSIAGTGLLALAAILYTGWSGYRRHEHGTAFFPHDFDSPAGRHGFLGFATLLLSGLSAMAVLYVCLAASFFGTCH